MEFETIREYLVSLKFAVDQIQWRKFEDVLKSTAQKAEKFAEGMAGGFAVAGTSIASVLAALTAGSIALMDRVAQNDLGFQMFARRMFMGEEAAKKLKIATDALGYSLEEIIWGPPELAERYRQLIKDQTVMMAQLGGPDFEKKMRNIRDIRFEFTRMGVEIQYFGMRLAEDLMNKLFGGSNSLEHNLDRLARWFMVNIPFFSYKITEFVGSIRDAIIQVRDLFIGLRDSFKNAIPDWLKGGGSSTGAFSKEQGKHPWLLDPNFNPLSAKGGLIGRIIASARASGHGDMASIAAALAVAEQESGIDPFAGRGSHGEYGPFQVMPFNSRGRNLQDPQANVEVGEAILFELYKKYGSWEQAFKHYNGSGLGADAYAASVMGRFQRWQQDSSLLGTMGPSLQNQSYSTDVGGVNIYITEPGATPDQIHKAVLTAINDHERTRARRSIASSQGAYA